MSDRVFEPETPNRFARFDPERAGEVSIRRTDEAASSNRFNQFNPYPEDEITGLYEPPEDQVSTFGAFRRGAVRGVAPAAAGLAVAGPAAEAGFAAGGLVAGPPGAFVGSLLGGVGGAILGGMAGDTAQHWALKALPDSWADALGMSERQQKLDEEQAPKASFLGGLAPYAITMRPRTLSEFSRKVPPPNATSLQRIMAYPATAAVFGAGIMGGMELGQETVHGHQPDWTKVAIATGFGLVFNKQTQIGEAISEIGARPTRRLLGLPERVPAAEPTKEPTLEPLQPARSGLGARQAADRLAAERARAAGIAPSLFHARPNPEPTVADAADLGVMGPGHTEATFQGSHEPAPAAVEAAHETKRTEQSVIGPDPAPPDAHSSARQMHFDMFNEYDPLKARERALEAEPGAAPEHLAATRARLAELEDEVKAAYRRAAEAGGHQIVEPEAPAAEVPPITPDIETQKATIAADVSQQLRAAGRPLDEAEAAGKLIAARYASRAGAFKGALGTPEELYRREGAEIRGEQIRRKVRTPAAARALEDFQQRMSAGKEQAQRRRNEGGSAVRIMTTAEKYAGVTEEEFNAAQREAEAAAPELKTMLTDADWEFMASPEFHQRKTAPPGPDLFTQREAEGQTNLPGTERISEPPLTGDEKLLAELPEGAKFIEGKGPLGRGKFAVEVDGKMVGNLMPTKEEAVKDTQQWLGWRAAGERAKAERAAGLKTLAAKLRSGGEPSDADMKLMGLRPGSSDLRWFIPAAAELFGIPSRAVRPFISGMIRTNYTDMGALREYVTPRDALRAIAQPADVGVEGKPQLVLPDAEKATEADLAKRRAAEPMKPGVAQKPMDIGLFSDEAKQRELFQRRTYTRDDLERMDIDDLDRMAWGHAQGETLTLNPSEINIKYTDDLENPKDKFRKEGMRWVNSVDFTDPVQVSIAQDGKFYLEDGHHRWFAAQKLNRPLTAEIEKIDGKPIEEILRRQSEDRELFQRELAPPFYSAVARTIETAKQAKASPDQWLATIRNTPGVKPEEMEWLGLEDWLKSQKGSVTKDQIADYVRANQIEVKEVTKGGSQIPRDIEAPLRAWMRESIDSTHVMSTVDQDRTIAGAMNGERDAIGELEGLGAPERILQPIYDALDKVGPQSSTKFASYTLPGGENHRELLLTLPEKGPQLPLGEALDQRAQERFGKPYDELGGAQKAKVSNDLGAEYAAQNFKVPAGHGYGDTESDVNRLAHIFMDDRTIDGKKTLLIKEAQSDWHAKGRHEGYKDEELTTRKQPNAGPGDDIYEAVNKAGEVVGRGWSAEEAKRIAQERQVPDAPFKTTWQELIMKRMIRYAAEHGYEQLAWVTGEERAARYDVSKQVKEINVTKESNGNFTLDAVSTDGRPLTLGENVKPEAMTEIIGKELAEKIAAQTEDQKSYSGLDLKVGGKMHRLLYDEQFPQAANKIGKKFGAKVEQKSVPVDSTPRSLRFFLDWAAENGDTRSRSTLGDAWSRGTDDPTVKRFMEDTKSEPIHTLPITDKLRDTAVEQGFPLFQGARGKINLMEGRRPIITLMKDANASTFIHESGHQFLEEILRDAQHELAPNQLRDDADTVLNWLGVKSAEDIKTREHEKFARGFEQYLREGHAPSPELVSVFARFKQWLMNIYQTIKGLGKEINPDIRAVFDRMLTTEPQRTVIAPERDLPRSLADIHEDDADFYAGHEMEGVGDRIAAEADRAYGESPHAPSLETKITAAEAADAGPEDRPGGPEGGEVQPGAGAAEPDAGRGGPGVVPPPERGGGAEGVSEGAGPREPSPEAGRERPDAVQLAGRPAADLTIGGESFNVGKDGNVRAENISSVPQLIEAIKESGDRIATGNDDILTMGQMQGIANDLGLDAKNLDEARIAGLFGGLHNIAAKIRAFREVVLTQSKTVHALMQSVKETNSDQAVAEFAKEAARLDMFVSALSSVTTEMGRGLGMGFRNLEGWKQAKDLNQFLKENTGKELFQLKMMAKLGSQLDSPAKVARFLRDAQNRSFGGMVLEYWINGLISGPATHATYAVGNAILTGEKLGPETAVAAMIGAGRRAMGREGETVRFGEVGAHFAGAIRGLPASLQAAAEGFRTGLTTLLPGEKARPLIPFTGDTGLVTAHTIGNEPVSWGELGADLFGMVRGLRDGIVSGAALIRAGGEAGAPTVGFSYSPLGQIPDIAIRGVPAIPLGSAIRVPGRFIAAIHSFFRTTNYSAYRAGGAYRAATQAAEEARAAGRAFSGSEFDAATAQHWLNPSESQMENYRHEATETSLMGHAGKFTENLQKLTNTEINLPVVGGVRLLKFIDPFVHISSNIIKQTVVERTPLGILSGELRADLSGKNGNIAQDTAMARMLVGSALSITFGGLAAQGYVTGSGPSDPHEAAMWREVYQAHSVRIGDMWYQVNRLGPMGMLLGIAADLYEVAHDAEEGEFLKAAAHLHHALTQNVLDESFMKGPADLIKAVEDPGRYGEGYIKNFASSFVPYSVGMAQMSRAMDPYTRVARNVTDAIIAKTPYSTELLPKRNIWGEEVPNLSALGGRAISALYEKHVNSDPVNQAMLDLGIHPAALERKIRNRDLTDQQYDDFTRIAGRLAKSRLDVIVNSPDWQRWPKPSRHDVIIEVIRQSREGARGMMMAKYPSIPRDATEALRKKKTGE